MRRASTYIWLSHAGTALAVALLCAYAGSVEASIFLAEEPLLADEHVLGDDDGLSGASSSSSSDRTPAEPPPGEDGSGVPEYIRLAHSQPDSSGMSTGASASAGGPATGGAFAINPTATVSLTAANLVTRLGGVPSFTLPTPPDNELLRPPQAA